MTFAARDARVAAAQGELEAAPERPATLVGVLPRDAAQPTPFARPLVERAATVIPGHGRPLQRDEALTLLEEDKAYLEALRAEGAGVPLPAGRRTNAQRRIHAENVERVSETGSG